jgi:hypothetical protein
MDVDKYASSRLPWCLGVFVVGIAGHSLIVIPDQLRLETSETAGLGALRNCPRSP